MQFIKRALLAAVLAGLACAVPVVAVDRTVAMRDNAYAPSTVVIRPGDTVTWVNDGQLPHDASGNGWSTSLLQPGSSDAVRFTVVGTYRYACTIHAEMRGTVIVRAGGTIPPTDTLVRARATPLSPLLVAVVGALGAGFALRRGRQAR